MEIAAVAPTKNFDKAVLDQINTLRTLRLNMAETMLRNLAKTKLELTARGLADKVDSEELRSELQSRIATLRSRLQEPARIYADELELYDELLAQVPDDLADDDDADDLGEADEGE